MPRASERGSLRTEPLGLKRETAVEGPFEATEPGSPRRRLQLLRFVAAAGVRVAERGAPASGDVGEVLAELRRRIRFAQVLLDGAGGCDQSLHHPKPRKEFAGGEAQADQGASRRIELAERTDRADKACEAALAEIVVDPVAPGCGELRLGSLGQVVGVAWTVEAEVGESAWPKDAKVSAR